MEEKGFLSAWAEAKFEYAKAVLFLFLVCHIVVIAHPRLCFDVSLIQLFRTLDIVRLKCQPNVVDAIKSVRGVPKDWITYGRLCSPRVLFRFYSDLPVLTKPSTKAGKLPPLKNLEHALEDQIYSILRKCRIVSKMSGNSLFAVPANQEYVYIETKPSRANTTTNILNHLINLCNGDADSFDLSPPGFSPMHTLSSEVIQLNCDKREEHTFRSFLWQHIEVAFTKGFDDNVRRHPGPSFFEVPSADCWFEVSNKLFDLFMSDSFENKSKQAFTVLHNLIDIDMKFSEARCAKVLPVAIASYQENLPSHYTQDYHHSKLEQAIEVFVQHARGPAVDKYVALLQEECENQWRNHRQMCETLSLTENHCINPQHVTSGKDNITDGRHLPVMSHSSGVKYFLACNCGRKQANRDDPFTVKDANLSFYESAAEGCCSSLMSVPIPAVEGNDDENESLIEKLSGLELEESGSENSPQEGTEAEYLDQSDILYLQKPTEETQSPVEDEESQPIQTVENCVDFMLHSECPPGYLPPFPSWSLVCLGPSSLYSHSHGIHDQPGFIQGSNFLLPWDVPVRVDAKEKWPAIAESMGKKGQFLKAKKGKSDLSEFNVKIFIGIEYECKRGHRFMMAAPDRVLKASGSGLVRDTAAKIVTANMPLYYHCPCRAGKPWVAQLMRIHVVTPKAPVHVTLSPQVQPAPSPCPTFYPGFEEPVRLSQSAYWVLRLPYVYMNKDTVYMPAKEDDSSSYGCLIKDLLGITEVTLE